MSTRSRAFRAVAVLAFFAVACSASKVPQEDLVHVTGGPVTIKIGAAPRFDGGQPVLHLDDMRFAEGEAAILRVFVNLPDATSATPQEHPSFVQELVLVPSRSRSTAPAPGQSMTLPLPPGTVKSGEPMTVTLVPVQADTEGRLTQPGKTDVMLARPYVTIER